MASHTPLLYVPISDDANYFVFSFVSLSIRLPMPASHKDHLLSSQSPQTPHKVWPLPPFSVRYLPPLNYRVYRMVGQACFWQSRAYEGEADVEPVLSVVPGLA